MRSIRRALVADGWLHPSHPPPAWWPLAFLLQETVPATLAARTHGRPPHLTALTNSFFSPRRLAAASVPLSDASTTIGSSVPLTERAFVVAHP